MTCQNAQESILDALAGPLDSDRRAAMADHVASCRDCASFAEIHQQLDARLAHAIVAAPLGAAFRVSLRENVRREATSRWPDYLPDLAHVIGCAAGVAGLAAAQPQYSGVLIPLGFVFTAATYFVQAFVRRSLEGWA